MISSKKFICFDFLNELATSVEESEADSDEDAVVPAPMNPVPDTTAVYGEAQDIHPAPLSRLKLPNTTAVSVEKLKTYIQHHSADSHC